MRMLPAAGALLTAAAITLTATATADAKPPSCQRDGAALLAASGKVRVVSIAAKPQNSETRRDRIYACRTPTGKRFQLFVSRDFGDDLIERDDIEIVDDRYVGALREFEGGVSVSTTAATWDTFKRTRLHTSQPCDDTDQGDFSGPEDAAFLPKGGLAYACGQLRIADAKGDRQLEAAGVRNVAVSTRMRGFGPRLYWTVESGTTVTPKFLDL